MVKKSGFQAAVKSTPSLSNAFRPGIQALGKMDRSRLVDRQIATGSVALEDTLKKLLPNANLWDYGIGLPLGNHNEQVLWLEVHPPAGGQLDKVLKKLAWLKDWLRKSAPNLDTMHRHFVWLLSRTDSPTDRQRHNQLAMKYGMERRQGPLRLSEFVARAL